MINKICANFNFFTCLTAKLISENNDQSGEQLLARIATEMSHPQPDVVVRGGIEILGGLAQKDIVAGTRNIL